MKSQELKDYINRILGNNIRCLLPSYWWKRIFGVIIDRIENLQNDIKADSEQYVNMIEVTYEELCSLRSRSKLIPGTKYRIIDYETVTIQENTRSFGILFDIIVTALDNSTLSEDASAIETKREHSYIIDNISKWKLKYTLDAVYTPSFLKLYDRYDFEWVGANHKGVIYEMIDEYGNKAPYDFKNIQFKLWYNGSEYRFSPTDDESYSEYWVCTFSERGSEQIPPEDFSAKGKGYETFYSHQLQYIYNVVNNEIVYTPNVLKPIFVEVPSSVKIKDNDLDEIHIEFYNNVIKDCCNIVLTATNNCEINNCENIYINAYSCGNIKADSIKMDNDNFTKIKVDKFNNRDTVTYIAKNSSGEIKVWNPADLVS